MRRAWSEADNAEFKRRWDRGQSLKMIARAFSISTDAVHGRARRMGLSRKYTSRYWSPEEAELALKTWQSLDPQMSETQRCKIVAGVIGRSPDAIFGRRRDHGESFGVHGKPIRREKRERPPTRDIVVPDEVWEERDKAYERGHQSISAMLMGDPLPGRSALDRRQA